MGEGGKLGGIPCRCGGGGQCHRLLWEACIKLGGEASGAGRAPGASRALCSAGGERHSSELRRGERSEGGCKEQQEGKCSLRADEYSSACMLRNQKFESLMVYYNYTFICAV